jgi:hypothetical protein
MKTFLLAAPNALQAKTAHRGEWDHDKEQVAGRQGHCRVEQEAELR